MLSIRIITSPFHAAGHLAIWVGLYSASAALCVSQISGVGASAAVFWVAGLTATSVYLLDRVKLADSLLDPADREAHPNRFRFLSRRTTLVRIVAFALGVIAMGVAFRVHPIATLFVPLACLGVLGYAGLPRRMHRSTSQPVDGAIHHRRLKDILFVKNIAVAACMTGFVTLLVVLDQVSSERAASASSVIVSRAGSIASASLFVLCLVLADAIMCDIDDTDADRKHGTATIPGRFGIRTTWAVAGTLQGVAAIMLLSTGDSASVRERVIWAGLVCASFAVLAICRPKALRDLIDTRLAVLAIIASFLIEM